MKMKRTVLIAGVAAMALNVHAVDTDARRSARCGGPIALVGPKGGGAHAPDENANVSSIDEMRDYLVKFLL